MIASRWLPRRLSVRVAVLFATVTLCLFAATGYTLDRLLWSRLEERDHVELVGKLELLRHLLAQDDDGSGDVLQDVLDAMIGGEGLALSVYDVGGRLLRHAGEPLALHRDDDVLPADAPADAARIVEHAAPAGPWRVLTARAPMPGRGIGWLVLGRNAELRRGLQAEYRQLMGAVLAIAAIATAGLGALGVWSGLRPLRRVTHAARAVNAQRLHERLAAPDAPQEVAELVRAFNLMLDRLDASFERLSRFSADLAHEFKTPLANLLLQSQVSLGQRRTHLEYQALIASNVEELERLSRMVDNMLFLARADNAQIAIVRHALDAGAELARVASYFEVLAEERGVAIDVQGRGVVHADAGLLRRAIGNLVANAIRHAEPGSRVRLLAAPGRIAVVNRGTPIAREELGRLFDRFYRADPARHDAGGSTGLGLAIVRSIVELHGGDATVRHEAGVTTFELAFPPPALGAVPRARSASAAVPG